MSRAPVLAVALGAVLALGACGDDSTRLPTAETPASLVGGGPACSPSNLRSAAEAFFGRRSAEARIAGEFKPNTVNTVAVTPYAYQLFAAIATRRNSDADWTGSEVTSAAALATHVVACTDLVFTEAALPGTGAMLSNTLTSALQSAGTFEVRGLVSDESSIVSLDAQAGLAPQGTYAQWLGTNSGLRPALVIGYPSNPFGDEMHGGYAYDWSLVRPRGAPALGVLADIALCTDDEAALDGSLRLQHLAADAGGNIVPLGDPVQGVACADVASASELPATLLGRAVRTLARAVAPTPLYAAVGKFGPVGGLIGSFSPVEVVYPGEIVLTYVTPPTDGEVNTPIPIAVMVAGQGGTPWEGVTVELTGFANNGQPLELCGATAVTDRQGLAVFALRVSKPGGLYLVATTVSETDDGDVTAYDPGTAESNRFNVRPATGATTACP